VLAAFLTEHEPIDKRGVEVVVQTAFCSLWVLDLSDNPAIGDTGAATLATLLRSNVTLRELMLEGCGIHVAGCAALALALRVNRGLRRLCLGRNANTAQTKVVGTHFGTALGAHRESQLQVLRLHDKDLDVQALCGHGEGRRRRVDLSVAVSAADRHHHASTHTAHRDSARPTSIVPPCAQTARVAHVGGVHMLSACELAFVTTVLAQNEYLQSLSVADSIHTAAHVKAIATAVKKNTTLDQLVLSLPRRQRVERYGDVRRY